MYNEFGGQCFLDTFELPISKKEFQPFLLLLQESWHSRLNNKEINFDNALQQGAEIIVTALKHSHPQIEKKVNTLLANLSR